MTEMLSRNWTVANGLPGNTVFALAQTADGFLWLGTAYGPVRFDGDRFDLADMRRVPGLRSASALTLLATGGGELWIGSPLGDITRLVGDGLCPLPLPRGRRGEVFTLTQDRAGQVWAGLGIGLCRYDPSGGSFSEVATQAGPFKAVVEKQTQPGQRWVHRLGEVCLLRDSNLAVVRSQPAGKEDAVLAVAPRREGGLWVAVTSGVGWMDESDRWRDFQAFPGGPVGWTAVLREDRRGDLWIGTPLRGLLCWKRGGALRSLFESGEVPYRWVRDVLEDRQGNLFLATDASGLARVSRRAFRLWNPEPGPAGEAINSVAPASAGGVWVATNGKGMFRFIPGRGFESLPDSGAAGISYPLVALEDGRQHLWIGTHDAGLSCLETTRGKLVRAWPEPGWGQIRSLAQNGDEGVWVGSYAGVSVGGLEADFRWVAPESALALAPGRSGRLWVGVGSKPDALSYATGVAVTGYVSGAIALSRPGEPAPPRERVAGLPEAEVTAILEDGSGRLWVGTAGAGLWVRAGDRWQTLGRAQGLASQYVSALVQDPLGCVWVSSPEGLVRLDPRGGGDGLPSGAGMSCVQFGEDQNLGGVSFEGRSQPRACQTADGRLWFAAVQGLLEVRPEWVEPAPPPLRAHIERVLVDGRQEWPSPGTISGCRPERSPPGGPTVRVPAGAGRISIQYTAISFVRGGQTLFRTRLEGLHAGWEEAGRARLAQYTGLRPGRYGFQVTARSPEGDWLAAPATVTLEVQPFYWQTWWFRAGAYAAGALAVGGMARWVATRRFRQRLAVLERERQLEGERSRIARDLHDDLGSNLTQIAYWSELARRQGEAARVPSALQRIAETAREAAWGLDQVVWILKRKNDTLEHLAGYLAHLAEEQFAGHPVRCRLEVPATLPDLPLPLGVRRSLFLATKEALTNVLKHAHAVEATLRLSVGDEHLRIVVEDNGCGFDPAQAQRGNGLEHLARRLAGIGGACEIESRPGAGTTVRLSWPLPGGRRTRRAQAEVPS